MQKAQPLKQEFRELSTVEGIKIPVCLFDDYVKQLDVRGGSGRSILFDAAFPRFRSGPPFFNADSVCPEFRKMVREVAHCEQPDGWQFKDGSGSFRRFSGNLILPRHRYFGVCRPNKYDNGAVAKEIGAYRQPCQTGIVMIHDMYDVDNAKILRACYAAQIEPGNYFLVSIKDPSKLDRKLTSLINLDTSRPAAVKVPYIVQQRRIKNVLDLRFGHVQKWFYETFSNPEITNWRFPLPPTTRFEDFLPLLLSQYRGGNLFTHTIGRELRRWGVNGFIYPSARCDVVVKK